MSKVMLRFLKTYIMMLIIPILFSFIIYFASYNIIEKTTRDASVTALNQAKSIYEQRFGEIRRMTYQLYTNSYALSFSHLSGGDNRQIYSRIIKTQNNLPNYNVTNNFIIDYYILFPKTGKVVNDRIAYEAGSFYQSFLSYDGLSYEAWLQRVTEGAAAGAFWKSQPVRLDTRYYGGLDRESIHAVTCLMNTGRNLHDGMSVIMLVDAREMENIISPVVFSPEDYACILDEDGLLFDINPNDRYYEYITRVLSGTGEPPSRTYTDTIDGERVFVTYTSLEELDWNLISIRPYKTVMSNLLTVQRVMVWTACISLLAGMGLAILFSIRKNSPAMSLFHDNERFQAQIEEQKPIVRSTLMERLFNGVADDQQIRSILRYLDIPPADFYACFVFAFDDEQTDPDSFERIKLIVRETVEPMRELRFHDIGSCRIAFLTRCESREGYVSAVTPMIDGILRELRPRIPCGIAVAIGKICPDIRKIPLSVSSAVEALNYRNREEACRILVADEVNPGGEHSLRNDEIILMLNQLEYCVKNGNSPEVENIFRKIAADLLGSDYGIMQNAVHMITFSVLNLVPDFLGKQPAFEDKIRESAQRLSHSALKNSPSDNIHSARKLCLEICDFIASENADKNNRQMDEIVEFLHRNYADSSLSLGMLSDRFGISETYISQLFKKHTHENISVYIENLRMARALELLQNPKLSIQEIIPMIGYNSTNTFTKAFKKKYGVPPTAYRDIR